MNRRELGGVLADNWLATINPFDDRLCDTGERHHGNPVFTLPLYLNGECGHVKLYRYTPTNAQHSILGFLPEGSNG